MKEYKFYGWEQAHCQSVTEQYAKIKTPKISCAKNAVIEHCPNVLFSGVQFPRILGAGYFWW